MGMSTSEAAPNSYTGSGPLAFPPGDGGHVSDRVPETSPCHMAARQIGELDPLRVTQPRRQVPAASRAAQVVGDLLDYASA